MSQPTRNQLVVLLSLVAALCAPAVAAPGKLRTSGLTGNERAVEMDKVMKLVEQHHGRLRSVVYRYDGRRLLENVTRPTNATTNASVPPINR